MITTLMAGFAFGYCVVDLLMSVSSGIRNSKSLDRLEENLYRNSGH